MAVFSQIAICPCKCRIARTLGVVDLGLGLFPWRGKPTSHQQGNWRRTAMQSPKKRTQPTRTIFAKTWYFLLGSDLANVVSLWKEAILAIKKNAYALFYKQCNRIRSTKAVKLGCEKEKEPRAEIRKTIARGCWGRGKICLRVPFFYGFGAF